jgi:hypothetical protein
MTFDFPDGASNGQTYTASNGRVYRYNGITWVIDSVSTISTISEEFLSINGDGVITGSSQLTSSFDERYTLSGSVQAITLPSDLVSSSAQITELGFISSSTTIDTGSFATTGSNSFSGSQTITGSLIVSSVAVVNGGINVPTDSILSLTSGSSISVDSSGAITGSLTGSVFGIGDVVAFSSSVDSRIISGSSVAGTISGSSQLTSSFDTRYTLSSSFSSISSSFDNRFNGLVTTGSNTFSGSQIFSGSMTVTSGQIIASTITNNSSSLFLQSGSNLYVQNNGLVEITGSLTATSITGSIAATNGVISGSSQLTTSFPSKTTGTWSVPAGASTRSFTVDWNHSYQMWVIGNIPNGIISWNATVNVTNANVPIVGSQYGWYYAEGGALVLTDIPEQIVGVNGVISSASFSTTTSNTFEFGITNNSGTTQTINYGYIKLS